MSGGASRDHARPAAGRQAMKTGHLCRGVTRDAGFHRVGHGRTARCSAVESCPEMAPPKTTSAFEVDFGVVAASLPLTQTMRR